ncbi:MAG: DUF1501 domain-containing protein [Planctomycetota bacterium]
MSEEKVCAGFQRWLRRSRRQVLQAGSLGALGLGLGAVDRNGVFASEPTLPIRAKRCIFLFMWGGPSQLDTFDMKPDAPAEIRGEFKPISTAVPGTQICEHFKNLSRLTDRFTIIRSLGHDDPAHLSSGHATLTGNPAPVLKSDAAPPSEKDSPHMGSLLSHLRSNSDGMPSFVTLPWKAFHPAAPGGEAPGQHGGWLGSSLNGVLLSGDPNHNDWKPQGLSLPGDISLERLESRRHLLQAIESQRIGLDRSAVAGNWTAQQAQAAAMLSSSRVQQAFDINAESSSMRERYGRNIHGQCVILARRLIESGVNFVSVNWHNDGQNFWDTHGNNFNRLKNDLIPPADMALSALIEDLESRGLLDETLIAWVGEFGRKPQITANNAGREHWPYCYSGILAGGGIRKGCVYGESDRYGAYPIRDAVTPQDFAATMIHQLGYDPQQMLHDRENRPHRLSTGKVIDGILA